MIVVENGKSYFVSIIIAAAEAERVKRSIEI